MTDNLTIFGTDYTGVTGIKATQTGNGELAYIRPSGTLSVTANGTVDVTGYASAAVNVQAAEFVVTLSQQTGDWLPDRTFAETLAAFQGGRSVVFVTDQGLPAMGYTDNWDDEDVVIYIVEEYYDSYQTLECGFVQYVFLWNTNGIELFDSQTYRNTDLANAEPSDVASGMAFFNADGYQTGTYVAPTARTASDVTVSGASVTVPAGAYASQVVKSVSSGTAGTPTATKGSVSNHAVSVTPSVTNATGYITGGTVSGTAVSVSASELVSGSQTITQNGTHDVTNLASVTVNVPTGAAKNVQAYRGYDTSSSTSYAATDVTLTVAKTGTYNVSWMGYRNTNSGTNGSQLYVNGASRGSAVTTFVNTYGQSASLTNQSFNQGDVLVVRARARSASYVMGVGNLIIEEV